MWKAILVAKEINQLMGGPFVAAWDVDQLPDEWLDTFEVLAQHAARKKYRNRLENLFVAFRQKHPSYRKYLS